MALPELRPPLRDLELYETKNWFFLVGRDKHTFRILNINREEEGHGWIQQDQHDYTRKQLHQRLEEIRMADGGNELNLVCKAYGLIGVVKLLECRYLYLITGRKKIGSLLGNYLYTVSNSRLVQIPVSKNKLPSIGETKCRNIFEKVDLSKGFYFSYSYDLTSTMQRLACHEVLNTPPPHKLAPTRTAESPAASVPASVQFSTQRSRTEGTTASPNNLPSSFPLDGIVKGANTCNPFLQLPAERAGKGKGGGKSNCSSNCKCNCSSDSMCNCKVGRDNGSTAVDSAAFQISDASPTCEGVCFLECNDMYVWNIFMLQPVLAAGKAGMLDAGDWVLPLIHGYVSQRLVEINTSGRRLRMTLLGRRSRHFAGTRLLRRGANIDGYCANYVETEQIITLEESMPGLGWPMSSSVCQVRGSIPLRWRHTNLLSPKPDICLSGSDRTHSVTRKHFHNLFQCYGKNVAVLSLIKQVERTPKESILGDAFGLAVASLNEEMRSQKRRSKDGELAEVLPTACVQHETPVSTKVECDCDSDCDSDQEKHEQCCKTSNIHNRKVLNIEREDGSGRERVNTHLGDQTKVQIEEKEKEKEEGEEGEENKKSNSNQGEEIEERKDTAGGRDKGVSSFPLGWFQQLSQNFTKSLSSTGQVDPGYDRMEPNKFLLAEHTTDLEDKNKNKDQSLLGEEVDSSWQVEEVYALGGLNRVVEEDIQEPCPPPDISKERVQDDFHRYTSPIDTEVRDTPIHYLTFDFLNNAKQNGSGVFDALSQISQSLFPTIGFFVGGGSAYKRKGIVQFNKRERYEGLHQHNQLRDGRDNSVGKEVYYSDDRNDYSSRTGACSLEHRLSLLEADKKAGMTPSVVARPEGAEGGELCAKGISRLQYGVLRTNCIDCLDRTNVSQFCYGKVALHRQIEALGVPCSDAMLGKVDKALMELFAEHGDSLAKQYGGSGAMHQLDEKLPSPQVPGGIRDWSSNSNSTSATTITNAGSVTGNNVPGGPDISAEREYVLTGGAKNALVAIHRYYSNNVTDHWRQRGHDLFLGTLTPSEARTGLREEPKPLGDTINPQGEYGHIDGRGGTQSNSLFTHIQAQDEGKERGETKSATGTRTERTDLPILRQIVTGVSKGNQVKGEENSPHDRRVSDSCESRRYRKYYKGTNTFYHEAHTTHNLTSFNELLRNHFDFPHMDAVLMVPLEETAPKQSHSPCNRESKNETTHPPLQALDVKPTEREPCGDHPSRDSSIPLSLYSDGGGKGDRSVALDVYRRYLELNGILGPGEDVDGRSEVLFEVEVDPGGMQKGQKLSTLTSRRMEGVGMLEGFEVPKSAPCATAQSETALLGLDWKGQETKHRQELLSCQQCQKLFTTITALPEPSEAITPVAALVSSTWEHASVINSKAIKSNEKSSAGKQTEGRSFVSHQTQEINRDRQDEGDDQAQGAEAEESGKYGARSNGLGLGNAQLPLKSNSKGLHVRGGSSEVTVAMLSSHIMTRVRSVVEPRKAGASSGGTTVSLMGTCAEGAAFSDSAAKCTFPVNGSAGLVMFPKPKGDSGDGEQEVLIQSPTLTVTPHSQAGLVDGCVLECAINETCKGEEGDNGNGMEEDRLLAIVRRVVREEEQRKENDNKEKIDRNWEAEVIKMRAAISRLQAFYEDMTARGTALDGRYVE